MGYNINTEATRVKKYSMFSSKNTAVEKVISLMLLKYAEDAWQ